MTALSPKPHPPVFINTTYCAESGAYMLHKHHLYIWPKTSHHTISDSIFLSSIFVGEKSWLKHSFCFGKLKKLDKSYFVCKNKKKLQSHQNVPVLQSEYLSNLISSVCIIFTSIHFQMNYLTLYLCLLPKNL